MQSTGQTSTQAVSFVPTQGSAMMYVICSPLSLRAEAEKYYEFNATAQYLKVRVGCPGPDAGAGSAVARGPTASLAPDCISYPILDDLSMIFVASCLGPHGLVDPGGEEHVKGVLRTPQAAPFERATPAGTHRKRTAYDERKRRHGRGGAECEAAPPCGFHGDSRRRRGLR